jgi:phosphoglycolate phosphatase
MSSVLFWDIDGTLLTTGRAGIFALQAAVEEVTGTSVDLQDLPSSGRTDAEVVALALAAAGTEDPALVGPALRAYERHLPACLPLRQGRVLDGVREILEAFEARDDVASFLLTGNTEAGATAKLSHYGLERFFTRGGSFCVDTAERTEIARRALPLANGTPNVFVIGDTPHDVRCGAAIGARTIAVASGGSSVAELAACEPWLVLERLPAPETFAELLGL